MKTIPLFMTQDGFLGPTVTGDDEGDAGSEHEVVSIVTTTGTAKQPVVSIDPLQPKFARCP